MVLGTIKKIKFSGVRYQKSTIFPQFCKKPKLIYDIYQKVIFYKKEKENIGIKTLIEKKISISCESKFFSKDFMKIA